ncbi:MAG: dTMP kinase [Deltaproteobacteria bacterium]|nr:MAG: dTMP kinase [Deltaproteobacteria bacterium]
MFITFEGIEGSGKTTQIKHIHRYYQRQGQSCVVTREPGGTEIGEKIRSILLDPQSNTLCPMSELLLYLADRAQHIKELVMPALAAGKTVLCDRFFDATVVYQGYARGVDTRLIHRLHELILEGFKPDATILLDLPPAIGLSRAWEQIDNGNRKSAESRFETEKLSFHEKVRAGYLELARREPERFHVIDANQEEDKVRRDIINALAKA